MKCFILSLALLTSIIYSIVSAQSQVPPFSCNAASSTTKAYPFCNVELSIKDRVHGLVSQLALEEKISQLINNASHPTPRHPHYLHGVSVAFGVENGISFKGSIKAATIFPQVILTASTFDVDLWYRLQDSKVSLLYHKQHYAK